MTVQEFKELLEDVAERIETDAHQIAQLTAENERLNRVVEQATTHFILRGTRIYARGGEEDVFIGRKSEDPDLFAQLKGAEL
jgi:hypothetical protein